MGADPYAVLCYGINLGEACPWYGEEFEGVDGDECEDADGWWFRIKNGRPAKDWTESYKFCENNPAPVQIVELFGGDTIYIVAVPGKVFETDWNESIEIDPAEMVVDEQKLKEFNEFVAQYIDVEDVTPKWLLSAYYV